VTRDSVHQIIKQFHSGLDGIARKSKQLSLDLLENTPAPFARDQFTPGHITCTALLLHPDGERVLMMHHHRLHRWLLPGGHIEELDASPAAAAAREAFEETKVAIDPRFVPLLVGVDVHGIPPKRDEPFHLHHDLIWCFRATNDRIEESPEAPQVMWASERDWDSLGLAESIRNSIRRAV
jgi:8-oxo-dGTP pyrophosphatase MutT (NUDIX family)